MDVTSRRRARIWIDFESKIKSKLDLYAIYSYNSIFTIESNTNTFWPERGAPFVLKIKISKVIWISEIRRRARIRIAFVPKSKANWTYRQFTGIIQFPPYTLIQTPFCSEWGAPLVLKNEDFKGQIDREIRRRALIRFDFEHKIQSKLDL